MTQQCHSTRKAPWWVHQEYAPSTPDFEAAAFDALTPLVPGPWTPLVFGIGTVRDAAVERTD
jgi:hypothetical protein